MTTADPRPEREREPSPFPSPALLFELPRIAMAPVWPSLRLTA